MRELGSAGIASAQAASNQVQRELDGFFEADSDQTVRLTSIMRRVEDLADRATGAVPTASESTKDRLPQSPGYVGVLRDLHATREQIGARIAGALERIEQVL